MLTTYKTTLTAKVQLTADVYHLKFTLNEPRDLSFIPGQYMIMRVPPENLPRLYSIVSPVDQKDSFELIIKLEPQGKASTYVLNMKVGDSVTFQGPAGVFRLKDTPKDKIFLATGCGLAPIRSMLLSLTIENRRSKIGVEGGKLNIDKNNQYSNINPPPPSSTFHHLPSSFYLFWGVPNYKDIYLFDELKNLKLKIKNFDFRICLSREQNLDMIAEEDRKYFALGRINDCLEEVSAMNQCEYYLCGSRHVTDSLKEYLLTEKKIPAEQVVFEKF